MVRIIIVLPLLAVFNGNIEVVWVNFAALAYGYLLCKMAENTKIGRRIFEIFFEDLIKVED